MIQKSESNELKKKKEAVSIHVEQNIKKKNKE